MIQLDYATDPTDEVSLFNVTTDISHDDQLWTVRCPWADVWEMLKDPVGYIRTNWGHQLRHPFVLVLEPQPTGHPGKEEAVVEGIENTGVVTVRGLPDGAFMPAPQVVESIKSNLQANEHKQDDTPFARLTLRRREKLAYAHWELGTDTELVAQYISNLLVDPEAVLQQGLSDPNMVTTEVDGSQGNQRTQVQRPENLKVEMFDRSRIRIIYDGSFTETCVSACNMTTGILDCDPTGCRVIVDNVIVKVYCPK